MISVAILGCGRIGQVHARSLAALPGAHVAAVADALPEAAARLARSTGAPARSVEAILRDEDVEAVIVGTPTDTHSDLIRAAAGAGKAIFCEKPVERDADRVRVLATEVEAAEVPFMVGFNRRFDPSFAALAERLRAGEIGAPEIVTILSRDPAPPPLSYIAGSGGLFRDMMIHDLDMARFLLGEEPVTVHATGSALVDPAIGAAGDVDTAAVMLTTASGRIAQISCSRRASYGYDQRIEVHGEGGMLRAENLHRDSVELADATGFRRAPVQPFFLERYAEAYRAEMAAFVAAIRDGTRPEPGIADGLRAQRLADAATLAWAEGRVVTV